MNDSKKPMCGIIMPISSTDTCTEAHWSEVRSILNDAIRDAGFEPNLVSDADDSGVIQKRIIGNLYEYPIVVCDVSAKNPNVMFELGMRLAFDKPTIVIKDDLTGYSFDTSPIEHIPYPRDLRFASIVEFKAKLTSKIRSTYDISTKNPEYTSFLKNFGRFTVAKIDEKEVSSTEFIVEEIRSLRSQLTRLERSGGNSPLKSTFLSAGNGLRTGEKGICMKGASDGQLAQAVSLLQQDPNVLGVRTYSRGEGHPHIAAFLLNDEAGEIQAIRRLAKSAINNDDDEAQAE